MKQGDIYKLTHPETLRVVKNGKEYLFQKGKRYKVSTTCDREYSIASLDASSDYPLIHKDFLKQNKKQFKKV